jgi:aminomuconate-semialdehyde/2-hydroxymuconate-6-semialdehyde dehydrogenase
MDRLSCYVAGRFREGPDAFEKTSPVDGELVALVTEADGSLVDEAVGAARNALSGPWKSVSVRERAAILEKVAAGIESRFDEFLEAEVRDTGKPVALASRLDVPRGASNFRVFAELIRTAGVEAYRTELPAGGSALNYAVRKPKGVVAVVTPWNLPLLLLTWKVSPALACGNAVVVKPSEETPSSATLLAEVMDSAGVPEGVFNVVHGRGPGAAGELLVSHPGVDAVTFTGESRTGAAILKSVAEGVKPVSFELGGKNPALVFADCDFEDTLDGVSQAVFTNTGQVCLCAERVYVERPLYDRFLEALKERAEALRLGWPKDESTTTGPLISKEHREKVLAYYRLARDEGARVVAGGGVPSFGDARDGGAWVEPTILEGLPESSRVNQEEIFGPVCHVAPFDDEDEAIDKANASSYGLAASVWTSRLKRGHRVAERLDVGIAWVNCWFLRDLRTPFGGVGLSGIGREGGDHSLNFYSEIENVCVKL